MIKKRKNHKKTAAAVLPAAAVFVLTVISIAFTGNAVVKNKVRDRIFDTSFPSGNYDCIIVPGCGLTDDGKPKQMLRARLDRAIELYESGVSEKLLMSGDHGRVSYDEVNAMKDYAMERGIPSENIFMDHAGFSTYETMYRAKAVFQVNTACVVTQKYHLYRAVYDAVQMGIEASGTCAEQNVSVKQAYREMREIIARNKDLIYCLLKPEPKYLGDTIPITWNGDATNDR